MTDHDTPPGRLGRFSTGVDQKGQSLTPTPTSRPHQPEGDQADELDAEDEDVLEKVWKEHGVKPKQ